MLLIKNSSQHRKKTILYIIVVSFLTLITLGSLFLREEFYILKKEEAYEKNKIVEIRKKTLKNNIELTEQNIYEQTERKIDDIKIEIKNKVYDVYAIIDHIYLSSGHNKNEKQIIETIHRTISSLYSSSIDYYFIVDLSGNIILNSSIPESEGKNVMHEFSHASQFVAQMIDIIKNKGEDYFYYTWKRPGADHGLYPKISYLKFFSPLNFFIGHGKYLDIINQSLQDDILSQIKNHNTKFPEKIAVYNKENKLINIDKNNHKNIDAYIQKNLIILKEGDPAIPIILEKGAPEVLLSTSEIGRWGWKIISYVTLADLKEMILEKEENYKHKLIYYIIIVTITISFLMTLLLIPVYNFLKTNQKMLSIQSQLISVVENSGEPIISINSGQEIVSWNRAATNLFGYSFEEMEGKKIQSIIKNENIFFQTKDISLHQLEMVHKNKFTILVIITESPIIESTGEIFDHSHKVLIIHDITIEKRREEELILAKRQAEMANQSKTLFLTNMGHEIRTPMNAILGFTEVLKEKISTDQELEYIGIIQNNAQKLVRIIDDILDMARLELGLVPIQSQPFNIEQILKEIENKVAEKIRSLPIEFHTHYQLNNFVILNGNLFRIRQILMHILDNAIKFTPKGAITLHTEIKSTENPLKAIIHFIVEDTGVGMNPDFSLKAFGLFTQEDEKHTRKFGGIGLGLTIVKNIVENMQGQIDISGEKGLGTKVSISLPLDLPHPCSQITSNPFDN